VGFLDLEEEHAVPVRPGDDPCAGVAESHRAVAPGCDQAGGQGTLVEPSLISNKK
jgi:hypothetical protein